MNEYPNNIYLKLKVAESLSAYLLINKDYPQEIIKEKSIKCLEIFQQIVESREPEYLATALFHIASINLNLENYKESEEAIKKLPKNLDPVTLYPIVLMKQGKNDEASKLCCNKLLNYINNSCLMLIMLVELYYKQGNKEKALLNLDACYRMQKIFKIRSEMTVYKYIELNTKYGNKEEAAKWFGIYIKELVEAEYDYENNPYFDRIVLEVKPDMQKIIKKKALESIVSEEEFQVLKGIETYDKAIMEAKSALERM